MPALRRSKEKFEVAVRGVRFACLAPLLDSYRGEDLELDYAAAVLAAVLSDEDVGVMSEQEAERAARDEG